MKIPDLSSVPKKIIIETPPKGSRLLSFETSKFGNLSQFVYLNEPPMTHVEPTYRLTDSYYCQTDRYCEDAQDDQVDPCVSVFGVGRFDCSNIPLHLYMVLCCELSRLTKPFDTDLLCAFFVDYYYYSEYQREDEDESDGPFDGCDPWIREALNSCQFHQEAAQLPINSLTGGMPESDESLAIKSAVDRIVKAERKMLSDAGPVECQFNGPESGLFFFPRNARTIPNPQEVQLDLPNLTVEERSSEQDSLPEFWRSGICADAISSAMEASYECENREHDLIHKCNNKTHLLKTIRYLKAVDNLIQLLCSL